MKARLVYWHKAKIQERYILEMEIHQVPKSAKYLEGVKYGLILKDLNSNKKVLMDNHHPKGPHIHLDDKEIAYQYSNEEKLVKDFRMLVFEHIGVKI